MLILSETLFNGLDHVATISKGIQDFNAIAGINYVQGVRTDTLQGLTPQEVYARFPS